MTTKVKPVPNGYHSVTPYMVVRNAADAIEFYKKAFGARERMRLEGPGGGVMHAEIEIGDSAIMLGEEHDDSCARGPETLGGTPVSIYLYVDDVDTVFARAADLGATVLRPVKDQFYGDRTGAVTDPFGHIWHVSTHIEDVSAEEIQKRTAAMFESQPASV